jgi:type I restriction enzyme, R subunit
MPTSKFSYHGALDFPSSVVREETIEAGFIGKLRDLKYEYRPDITNRAMLEANFREKFEALNRVRLTASKTLRAISSFTRNDGTPLNYTLGISVRAGLWSRSSNTSTIPATPRRCSTSCSSS